MICGEIVAKRGRGGEAAGSRILNFTLCWIAETKNVFN